MDASCSWWLATEDPEEQRLKEAKHAKAMEVLRQNRLLPGPWMRPLADRNWESQFHASSGGSIELRAFGVRDGLRLRAASTRCREAIEADSAWCALILLCCGVRRSLQPFEPTIQEWSSAYAQLMFFGVLESSLEMRLEIAGLDEETTRVYAADKKLRFGVVHTSEAGIVAVLHLGYNPTNHAVASVSEAPEDCDWSMAPPNFADNLLGATGLRAVLRYNGRSVILSEALREDIDDHPRWPEAHLTHAASEGSMMSCHNMDQLSNYCCEFALHLTLSIPTYVFLPVLCGSSWAFVDRMFYPSKVKPLPPKLQFACLFPSFVCNTDVDGPVVTLVGELWFNDACEAYAKYFSGEDADSHCQMHCGFRRRFQAQVVGTPSQELYRDVPESTLLTGHAHEATVAKLLQTPCLRHEMALEMNEDDWWPDWAFPDRLSFWALDGCGRSWFQSHNLQLFKQSDAFAIAFVEGDGSMMVSVDLKSAKLALLRPADRQIDDHLCEIRVMPADPEAQGLSAGEALQATPLASTTQSALALAQPRSASMAVSSSDSHPEEYEGLHADPAAAIEPEEAAHIQAELYTTNIERLLASTPVMPQGFRRSKALLTFSRSSRRLDEAVLSTSQAEIVREQGLDPNPPWSRGTKILVIDIFPEHLEPPFLDDMVANPSCVIVYEDDVDDFLQELREKPGTGSMVFRVKPACQVPVLPDEISLMAVSEPHESRPALEYSDEVVEIEVVVDKGFFKKQVVQSEQLEVASDPL